MAKGFRARPIAGDTVMALHFEPGSSIVDDNDTVPPGTRGTVRGISSDQIHVEWDNGSSISILIDSDHWEVL